MGTASPEYVLVAPQGCLHRTGWLLSLELAPFRGWMGAEGDSSLTPLDRP